jgi:hypothetical protein
VTHYFEVVKKPEPGLSLFVHLDGPAHHSLDHVPLEGALPIDKWNAGDFIIDRTVFAPRPDAALGTYQMTIGFYRKAEEDKGLEARLVPNGNDIDRERRVSTARIEVVGVLEHPERFITSDCPTPQRPVNVTFGDAIELVGYDLDRDKVKPGLGARATYYFRVLAHPPPAWQLAVRLEGPIVKRLDHVPIGGTLPVGDWPVGQCIADPHDIITSTNDLAGDYELLLGFDDPTQGGEHVAARGSAADVQNRARLGHLRIAEVSAVTAIRSLAVQRQ